MAKTPEDRFIQKVHTQLQRRLPSLFIWKIRVMGHNGIPDVWYSGRSGDLWVEYKYLSKLPAKTETPIYTGLSGLQRRWLQERHTEGRSVACIIGTQDGAVVLDQGKFPRTVSNAFMEQRTIPIDMAVDYILRIVGPDRTAPHQGEPK